MTVTEGGVVTVLVPAVVGVVILWLWRRGRRRQAQELERIRRQAMEDEAAAATAEAAARAAEEVVEKASEREVLEGWVRDHQGALGRNLDKALVRNDYGAVVKDRTEDVLEEFYWSVGYARKRLAAAEARRCVFRGLGRKDPGPHGPPAAKAGGGAGGPWKAVGERKPDRERDHNDFGAVGQAMVIDVETTGLDSERDRIVSLAMIEVDLSRLTEQADIQDCILRRMQEIFDPGVKIPRAASRIHGLRAADVRGKPSFEERAVEIRDVIGTLPLIGHNVGFDKKFLSAGFKRAGVKTLQRNRSHCTMWRYRTRHSGPSSLDAVVKAMGLEGRSGQTHLAEEDTLLALAVACVFHLQDR